MVSTPVRFRLSDGEVLTLPDDDLRRAYELLWELAPKPGAVSTAATLRGLWSPSARVGSPIELTSAQSGALREVVALLHAERSE